MADKYTAETAPYKEPGKHTSIGHAKISYGPKPTAINPLAYGRTTGKPNAADGGTIPSVEANSYEEGTLPTAFTGDFSIGENKNVSAPVTGR